MKKTLIREGLLGLSKKDKQSFLKFIHSPYFNTREDLTKIAVFLLSDSRLESEELTKKDVFDALFDGLPYDDQKIRLLLSYLQKKLETFLTIEELQKNDGETSWWMLRAMQQRNLQRNYTKKINYFRRHFDQRARQDWSHYYEKYRVELMNLDVSTASSKKSFNYEVLTESLDRFYLSAKLRHACTAISYQIVFDQNYRFPLLDDVLEVAAQEKFLKVPAISIYYLFIKVMNGGEEVDFVKLKETLFKQQYALSSQEFHEVYTMVLNFYIQKINQNKLEFVPEALSFYKKGLDLGLLLENGYFQRFKYSNIVAMGLQVGETEWVANFIEEYKMLLRKSVRVETYSLNKARLAYQLKEYDKALKLLTKVNYDELFYAITARIIKIKIYLEKGELELLDYQLRSLKFFLKRKKVVGYHSKNWGKIIDYTRKLAELNPYDKEKRTQLREEIVAEDILTEKAWLLEQLDNL